METQQEAAELARLRAEVAHLRATLAHERARADRLEETLHEAVQANRTQAEAMVTLVRDARSVTVTRNSVTGTVTLVEREEKKREQARVRMQNYRHRHRDAFREESDGFGTVTPSSPPPSSQGVSGPPLRVVTQAARNAVTQRSRVIRNAELLPPEVQRLRGAWNDQVVPHGFAHWGDTSSRLLEEAEAALQRRPLAEWRQVFALVPRSRVCRGELSSRLKYTIVRVLGFTSDGHEVADCLLSGAWSIDPEQREGDVSSPGSVIDCDHLAPGAEGEAALETWNVALGQMRGEGKTYALQYLEEVAPVAVREGALLLRCRDELQRDYLGAMFSESLSERLIACGVEGGVRFTCDAPGAAEEAGPESPPPGTLESS